MILPPLRVVFTLSCVSQELLLCPFFGCLTIPFLVLALHDYRVSPLRLVFSLLSLFRLVLPNFDCFERGADTCVLNEDGLTAYQVALRQGHRNVADLFRDHGTRAAA